MPERGDQRGLRNRSELSNGANAEGGQPLRGRGADAPEATHLQGMEEVELRARLDDQETVRFREIARQLGHHLGSRHPDRCREPDVSAHPSANRDGDLRARTVEASGTGDVEERFVERDRLDHRRERVEHGHDLGAGFVISVEARSQEHAVRAGSPRPPHRGGRIHAELAGLVARRGHDAAGSEAAHDHGPPPQTRIVELLDRRVERVEIDVEDARFGATTHGRDVRTTRIASRLAPKTSYA